MPPNVVLVWSPPPSHPTKKPNKNLQYKNEEALRHSCCGTIKTRHCPKFMHVSDEHRSIYCNTLRRIVTFIYESNIFEQELKQILSINRSIDRSFNEWFIFFIIYKQSLLDPFRFDSCWCVIAKTDKKYLTYIWIVIVFNIMFELLLFLMRVLSCICTSKLHFILCWCIIYNHIVSGKTSNKCIYRY